MTDLLHVLPNFPTSSYTHLLPSLEKNLITTSDLLTLDALDIAKRAQLPILDIRRFVGHIVGALRGDLGIAVPDKTSSDDLVVSEEGTSPVKKSSRSTTFANQQCITLLDPTLDSALEGGLYTGYVTEITGESGVGKTQFLWSLLLSAQLPPPHGLGRSTIYISTEAPLSTKRLAQMLQTNPAFTELPPAEQPKLENVRAVPCGDLEAQDHIIEYQLPAAVEKFNVGLVVLDSVAANYRAEHGSSLPKDLANRAARLAKLGHLLRKLAVNKNLAVVVANQVSDRMDANTMRASGIPSTSFHSSSPVPSSSPAPTQYQPQQAILEDPLLSLDHQQRFFTGWGDERMWTPGQKTPALGLGWTNQIACRIALKMEGTQSVQEPVYTQGPNGDMVVGGNIWSDRSAKRYMKVVFCPWAPAHEGTEGIQYEITGAGIRAITEAS